MKTKKVLVWLTLIFTGIILCTGQKANASISAGLTPSSYGNTQWGDPPVIIERGDTSVYEFTFRGHYSSSEDCSVIPHIEMRDDFAPEDVFLSFDPDKLVTEQTWEVQHISAGETLYWEFTAYVSNPQLPPTIPDDPLTLGVDDYYRLRPMWSPYRVDAGGTIGTQLRVWGVIAMQVTPEPATLVLFGLGGLLIRRRHQ